ncbi:MAG: TRAP transporter substrate-binding protein [Hyphomicrobiales bacterium]|nr:TRAP transporter substrate-binding protein [Hyphomicrobiales bacterium]
MIGNAIRTILLAVMVLAATAHSSMVSAETVTLRMATWVPPMHHLHQTFTEWAAQIERASGGSLKVVLDEAPLAKAQGQYELAKKGIADLAFPVLGYMPDRFAVTRGIELPFLSPSAEVGSQALWDWGTRNIADQEFNDVKLVTLFVHGPGMLHSKTRVRTHEDLAGMRLRVGGGGVAIARALGAVPVAMTAADAHQALLRGTTQGTLFPWEAVASYRLTGLVRYHLEIPGGLYTTVFAVVMNKARYESLAPEHKALIDRFGGGYGAAFIGRHWDEADRAAREEAKVNGEYIHTLAPEELKRWRAKIAFMDGEWIVDMTEQGHDAAALLDDLRKTVSKFQDMQASVHLRFAQPGQ